MKKLRILVSHEDARRMKALRNVFQGEELPWLGRQEEVDKEEMKLAFRELLAKDDSGLKAEVLSWIEIPECFLEMFDMYCHHTCAFSVCKEYNGCDELSCFQVFATSDIKVFREELTGFSIP